MKLFFILLSLSPLLLVSCSSLAGYEITPSVSYTDADGHEMTAKVKIKAPKIKAAENDK